MLNNKIILYGLAKYKEIIDKITEDLNVSEHSFDIKLILTEALTNAFKHGNKGDSDKPIYLSYHHCGTYVRFEIEDCGDGINYMHIPNDPLDDDLLNSSGRGLFIISSIADKIELNNNTLIIQKSLK